MAGTTSVTCAYDAMDEDSGVKRAANTLTEATTMKRGGSYETQQWYSEMMVPKGRQRYCCSGLCRSGRTTIVLLSIATSTVTPGWVVGREEHEKKRKANPAALARPNCICICAPWRSFPSLRLLLAG